jgi:hypothetical protein
VQRASNVRVTRGCSVPDLSESPPPTPRAGDTCDVRSLIERIAHVGDTQINPGKGKSRHMCHWWRALPANGDTVTLCQTIDVTLICWVRPKPENLSHPSRQSAAPTLSKPAYDTPAHHLPIAGICSSLTEREVGQSPASGPWCVRPLRPDKCGRLALLLVAPPRRRGSGGRQLPPRSSHTGLAASDGRRRDSRGRAWRHSQRRSRGRRHSQRRGSRMSPSETFLETFHPLERSRISRRRGA